MSETKTKSFEVDGHLYRFDGRAFNSIFNGICIEKNMGKGQMEDQLVKKLRCSAEAIRKWKSGRHAPSDFDRIMSIAAALEVPWEWLVKEEKADMKQLTDRQKDAAKRIYDVLIWFLDEFRNTDGFNSWWSDCAARGSDDPDYEVIERITGMEERIKLVLDQEYFDLHDREIYDELCEFAGEHIPAVYTGKVGGDGRAEAAWRDYEKAVQCLNEIIERYV